MKIEYKHFPGFVMEVLEQEPCQGDEGVEGDHPSYRIVDPEGAEDWLCGHDVNIVEA
jgi:hypothetical protein